jgi:hypothetical protein
MSGNPRELREARRVANEAAAILEGILALPRRKGSRVIWRNGVIWERRGDDDWRPVAHTVGDEIVPTPEDQQTRYRSAHIASFGFWDWKGTL